MKKILPLLLLSLISSPCYAAPKSEDINDQIPNDQMTAQGKTTAEEAFEKALRLHTGLTPQEIKSLRDAQELQDEASLITPNADIKSGTINISFSSTKPIPKLILTPHYVGAIAFFDAAGNPWAISKAIVGSSENFDLISNPYEKLDEKNNIPPDAHILYITAKNNYANSNMVVYLAEAKQPFIIPVTSSSQMSPTRSHNGLISYRIDSFSPFSNMIPEIDYGTPIDKTMLDILDGVEKNAKLVKNTYNKDDLQVYGLNNKMYIRTKHTLIFPAPVAKVVVGDRKVYEIAPINSLVISFDGVTKNVDLLD